MNGRWIRFMHKNSGGLRDCIRVMRRFAPLLVTLVPINMADLSPPNPRLGFKSREASQKSDPPSMEPSKTWALASGTDTWGWAGFQQALWGFDGFQLRHLWFICISSSRSATVVHLTPTNCKAHLFWKLSHQKVCFCTAMCSLNSPCQPKWKCFLVCLSYKTLGMDQNLNTIFARWTSINPCKFVVHHKVPRVLTHSHMFFLGVP